MIPDHPPCRRFNLGDGMILIAAISLALGILSKLARDRTIPPEILGATGFALIPLVATPAYLAIRLRQPRPPLDQLIRQPGMAGCLTAIASILFLALLALTLHTTRLFWLVPPTVIGTWIALLHHGQLRPEPGWIDRLGRLLAALLSLLSLLLSLL
jgi:hypothetical protein